MLCLDFVTHCEKMWQQLLYSFFSKSKFSYGKFIGSWLYFRSRTWQRIEVWKANRLKALACCSYGLISVVKLFSCKKAPTTCQGTFYHCPPVSSENTAYNFCLGSWFYIVRPHWFFMISQATNGTQLSLSKFFKKTSLSF